MNYRFKKGFVTFPVICFLSFISIVSLMMMVESVENSKLLKEQKLTMQKDEGIKDNIRLGLQVMKHDIEEDGIVTEGEIKEYGKKDNINPFKVSINFDEKTGYIRASYKKGTGIEYVEYFDFKIKGNDLQEVIFLSV